MGVQNALHKLTYLKSNGRNFCVVTKLVFKFVAPVLKNSIYSAANKWMHTLIPIFSKDCELCVAWRVPVDLHTNDIEFSPWTERDACSCE